MNLLVVSLVARFAQLGGRFTAFLGALLGLVLSLRSLLRPLLSSPRAFKGYRKAEEISTFDRQDDSIPQYKVQVVPLKGLHAYKVHGIDLADLPRPALALAAARLGKHLAAQGHPAALPRCAVFQGCIILSTAAHMVQPANPARRSQEPSAAPSGSAWDAVLEPDPYALLPASLRDRVTLVEVVGSSDDAVGALEADPPALSRDGGRTTVRLTLTGARCASLAPASIRAAVWCEASCAPVRAAGERWARERGGALVCDMELDLRACPSSLVIRVGLAGPDGHLASMLSYSCLVPVLETGASAAEASIHPELCTDLAHLLGLLCGPGELKPEDFSRGGLHHEWLDLAFSIRAFAARNELEGLAELMEQSLLPRMLAGAPLAAQCKPLPPPPSGSLLARGVRWATLGGHCRPWLTFKDAALERAFLAECLPRLRPVHLMDSLTSVPVIATLHLLSDTPMTSLALVGWLCTVLRSLSPRLPWVRGRPGRYLALAAVQGVVIMIAHVAPLTGGYCRANPSYSLRELCASSLGGLVALVKHVNTAALTLAVGLTTIAFGAGGHWVNGCPYHATSFSLAALALTAAVWVRERNWRKAFLKKRC